MSTKFCFGGSQLMGLSSVSFEEQVSPVRYFVDHLNNLLVENGE